MLTRPSKTMSAPDTNTDDVEELPEQLSASNGCGRMGTDGPGEFHCPACGARCTRNETNGTEYGHLLDCPERELPDPRDLDLDGGYRHRLAPNVGESVQKSKRSTQLQNCLNSLDEDDDSRDLPVVEPPAPE